MNKKVQFLFHTYTGALKKSQILRGESATEGMGGSLETAFFLFLDPFLSSGLRVGENARPLRLPLCHFLITLKLLFGMGSFKKPNIYVV